MTHSVDTPLNAETAREVSLALWRRAGGVGRVPVQGSSMLPILVDADRVRVHAGLPVRFGDIAVAETAAGLVVHRCLGRTTDTVLLRGDNTPAADLPCSEQDIVGRVTAVEGPDGRRLDIGCARWMGLAAASYGRFQRTLGHRPRRPRPRALMAAGLAVERAFLPPMTPEDAFILLAARLQPSLRACDRALGLIAAGLDWDQVAERARLGQIGPLVFQGLKSIGDAADVPDMAVEQLRRQTIGNRLRSQEMTRILGTVLERLAAEGIPVLAHKGVALAATVYLDPALRIAADIDLSVRDADRARAEAAVSEIRKGLVQANPDRRSASGYHIELDGTIHHDLEPSLFGTGRWQTEPLDWEGIWDRAETVELSGGLVLVPCPTDMLVTLVANSLRRGFSPIRLVADIAATIGCHGPRIDWAAVETTLRRTRLDQRAWLALDLAADWFDADVPARLVEPPRDLRMAGYERWLLAHKRRRPFSRLPTSVLWAGSSGAALRTAWALGWKGRTLR